MAKIDVMAKAEADRLTQMLVDADVSHARITALENVIVNTAWMSAKLDVARSDIGSGHLTVKYDNGGGQKGVRQNPLFSAYEDLFKSYMNGMKEILATLPREVAKAEKETADEKITVLDKIRKRHNA